MHVNSGFNADNFYDKDMILRCKMKEKHGMT